MLTIGVDPHKQTHTAAAVDELGSEVGRRTVPARPAGNGQLLEWARALDGERVWAVEDVRNVSGSLERFLIDRGETVVRLAPQLMAGARRGVRTRGKSDPIDATAIARAALREGIENAPDGAACWPRTRDPDARAVSRAAFRACAPGYPMSCAGSCTTCGPTGSCLPRRSPMPAGRPRSPPGSRALSRPPRF